MAEAIIKKKHNIKFLSFLVVAYFNEAKIKICTVMTEMFSL